MWRLYWFFKNLLCFFLFLLIGPIHIIWLFLIDFCMNVVIVFTPDGSQEISYPWKWNWWIN